MNNVKKIRLEFKASKNEKINDSWNDDEWLVDVGTVPVVGDIVDVEDIFPDTSVRNDFLDDFKTFHFSVVERKLYLQEVFEMFNDLWIITIKPKKA